MWKNNTGKLYFFLRFIQVLSPSFSLSLRMYDRMYVHMYVCMYVFICMYVCMYVCIKRQHDVEMLKQLHRNTKARVNVNDGVAF